METKRFALFLRHIAESLREDLHSRKALTGKILEDYAEELDPTARPAEPVPEATAEPALEEAPIVAKIRETHAAKEADHGRHHKR